MIDLSGPAPEVAPLLLGCRLRSRVDGTTTEVVLTEVEAYGGGNDPASHAFGGITPRNRSMFGPAGTLYVYRSYGLHWCANIVTGRHNEPGAILLRSGVPTVGLDAMAQRRGRTDHLTDGPGKLCQALGISGELDGRPVGVRGALRLLPGTPPAAITDGPRVGISRGTELRWRFSSADS